VTGLTEVTLRKVRDGGRCTLEVAARSRAAPCLPPTMLRLTAGARAGVQGAADGARQDSPPALHLQGALRSSPLLASLFSLLSSLLSPLSGTWIFACRVPVLATRASLPAARTRRSASKRSCLSRGPAPRLPKLPGACARGMREGGACRRRCSGRFCRGAEVQWCSGAVVPWCSGAGSRALAAPLSRFLVSSLLTLLLTLPRPLSRSVSSPSPPTPHFPLLSPSLPPSLTHSLTHSHSHSHSLSLPLPPHPLSFSFSRTSSLSPFLPPLPLFVRPAARQGQLGHVVGHGSVGGCRLGRRRPGRPPPLLLLSPSCLACTFSPPHETCVMLLTKHVSVALALSLALSLSLFFPCSRYYRWSPLVSVSVGECLRAVRACIRACVRACVRAGVRARERQANQPAAAMLGSSGAQMPV
jgi:hypothetical protein